MTITPEIAARHQREWDLKQAAKRAAGCAERMTRDEHAAFDAIVESVKSGRLTLDSAVTNPTEAFVSEVVRRWNEYTQRQRTLDSIKNDATPSVRSTADLQRLIDDYYAGQDRS